MDNFDNKKKSIQKDGRFSKPDRLFIEDMRKRYKEHMLKADIFLWQIHIIEHPEDKECYEEGIADNLKKLKNLVV